MITARSLGLTVLLIEKAPGWVRASAISGAGHWVPVGPVALANGKQDTIKEG
jgi:hypothetical protein